ncbi:hypothetical protein K5R88_07995 [Pseudomonas sp. MM213]|uniref:OmpP1/FadL family transporter n=1 Tax=Pseudomonas sp. MM213 TaxID=2866807 RepID=UPI001CF21F02|nr:hypothetical protein [Pseudomonas sp. MM213]UCP11561.1 hypothetical protein K5R88_07995 [Pseudomonas sp. MM213]
MKQPFIALTMGALVSATAQAANYGTDFNLTMLPASGGMAGVGVARPLEPAAALYGNPAALTQFRDATRFSLGATYFEPSLNVEHDGSVTGAAWADDSKASSYLIPAVAITQPLGENDVLGFGFTVVSGVGSDFKGAGGPHPGGCSAGGGVYCTSASLDPNAEMVVFGANVGYGHRFSDALSGGVAITVAQGYAQMPLNSDTSSVHAFGVRATLGINYDVGATTIGAYYRSPMSMRYQNLFNNGPGKFSDTTIEQPQEFAFGIANRALMNGKLLIALDVLYKDWSSAEFYKDIYESQTVIATGAELTTGAAKWRIGYSHVNSPIKNDVGSSIAGNNSFALNGVSIPLNPPIVQYLQAVDAAVIWLDQVTLGAGYEINKNLRVDSHLGLALNRSEQIGANNVEAKAWQLGAGLTWSF